MDSQLLLAQNHKLSLQQIGKILLFLNICAERAYFRMEFMLNNTQHTNSLGFMKNIDLPHCPYDFPWSFLILGLLAVSLCFVFGVKRSKVKDI